MQVEIPTTCGNAPRHQIITTVIAAMHDKNLDVLNQWFAEDIRWEIAGEQLLQGTEVVQHRILRAPETSSLKFLSVLTHGSWASADGQYLPDGSTATHFSHVLRFASAGKSAKIKEIRSYYIQSHAREGED